MINLGLPVGEEMLSGNYHRQKMNFSGGFVVVVVRFCLFVFSK